MTVAKRKCEHCGYEQYVGVDLDSYRCQICGERNYVAIEDTSCNTPPVSYSATDSARQDGWKEVVASKAKDEIERHVRRNYNDELERVGKHRDVTIELHALVKPPDLESWEEEAEEAIRGAAKGVKALSIASISCEPYSTCVFSCSITLRWDEEYLKSQRPFSENHPVITDVGGGCLYRIAAILGCCLIVLVFYAFDPLLSLFIGIPIAFIIFVWLLVTNPFS